MCNFFLFKQEIQQSLAVTVITCFSTLYRYKALEAGVRLLPYIIDTMNAMRQSTDFRADWDDCNSLLRSIKFDKAIKDSPDSLDQEEVDVDAKMAAVTLTETKDTDEASVSSMDDDTIKHGVTPLLDQIV